MWTVEECLYNTSGVFNIEVLVSGYGVGPKHWPMYAFFCDVIESDLTKVVTFGRYTDKWKSDASPNYTHVCTWLFDVHKLSKSVCITRAWLSALLRCWFRVMALVHNTDPCMLPFVICMMESDLTKVVMFGRYTEKWISDACRFQNWAAMLSGSRTGQSCRLGQNIYT